MQKQSCFCLQVIKQMVERAGMRPDRLLLLGGLGSSAYLQHMVQSKLGGWPLLDCVHGKMQAAGRHPLACCPTGHCGPPLALALAPNRTDRGWCRYGHGRAHLLNLLRHGCAGRGAAVPAMPQRIQHHLHQPAAGTAALPAGDRQGEDGRMYMLHGFLWPSASLLDLHWSLSCQH